MPGLVLKMAELTLSALAFEVFDASLDVLLPTGQQGVDEACELVRRRLDGTRRVQPSQP